MGICKNQSTRHECIKRAKDELAISSPAISGIETHAYETSYFFWDKAEKEVEFTMMASSLCKGHRDLKSCRHHFQETYAIFG